MINKIALGLEILLAEKLSLISGSRVGLICNPASVDHDLRHAADLCYRHPGVNLTALFGPQHGIRGETQDNMVEWEGFRDPRTGVMAYSLYGEFRKPTEEMLRDVDAQHLLGRLAKLAVKRIGHNASARVAEALPFNHVVLRLAANSVLRSEEGRQINVGATMKQVCGMPEIVIYGGRVANQSDARSADEREFFRQQNLQSERDLVNHKNRVSDDRKTSVNQLRRFSNL